MAKRYLWVVEAKRNGKWAHVNDEASHAIKHGQFAPCETWASGAEAPHA